MIKRIVVALDPDDDTPVATKYAIRLAKRFDASLTGLAIIPMESELQSWHTLLFFMLGSLDIFSARNR